MTSQYYLGSLISTLHFWGIPADLETPAMATGSFELSGPDGAIALDVLVGPQGEPGMPSPIVKMQYHDDITDSEDLPDNLQNIALDIGKAWWVGNQVWVWMGTGWYQRQMGVPGPAGPIPTISPSIQIIPSGNPDSLSVPAHVAVSGTALNPGFLFQFDQDSITGPPGPASLIRGASDYDNTIAPDDGDAVIWSSAKSKFIAGGIDIASVRAYSVPESAFSSYLGFGTQQLIAAYGVPPQPFAWKPFVFGHVAAQGIDLTINPLRIGAEVLLGDPLAGQRIGRGFGNIANMANIIPHFSYPSNTGVAVTPDNGTAVVPAYHSGSQGTVYVRLYNDGAIGEYSFSSQNAQLIIFVIPVTSFQMPGGS